MIDKGLNPDFATIKSTLIDDEVETIDDIVELYAKKCLFLRYRDKWEFIKPIAQKDYF